MIKEKLLEASKTAKTCVDALNSDTNLDEEKCFYWIKKYVYAKFLLDEGLETDGTIADLARESISRMLSISKEEVDKKDFPSCYGATAVWDKKVLLLMRLEKDLGIFITAEESAALITLKDLSHIVCRKKGESAVKEKENESHG